MSPLETRESWMQQAADLDQQFPQPQTFVENRVLNHDSTNIRQAITNYLAENFPLRQSIYY